MAYLYDPRANVMNEISYELLMEMTGHSLKSLYSYKTRKQKIKSIQCYLVDKDLPISQKREWYAMEEFKGERWKPMEGSERGFLVSNYGRVKRQYKTKESFILPFPRKQNGNHLFVKCDWMGRYGDHKVSQLVAHHFIGPIPKGMSVRHRNGIRTDCYVRNLEFLTKEQLGRLTGRMSKSMPVAAIDAETGEIVDEFRSAREAARNLFLSYQAVLDNCHGKTKIAGGMYHFRFVEDLEDQQGA